MVSYMARRVISSFFRCFCSSSSPPSSPRATSPAVVNLSQNERAVDSNFPMIIYDSNTESESCSICLEELVRGDEIRVLTRCMHVFHKDCIDQWLPNRSVMCPICRTRAVDDDDHVVETTDLTTTRVINCRTMNVGRFHTQFHIAHYL